METGASGATSVVSLSQTSGAETHQRGVELIHGTGRVLLAQSIDPETERYQRSTLAH